MLGHCFIIWGLTIVLIAYGEIQIKRHKDYDTAITCGKICTWLNLGLCVVSLISALVNDAG